MYQPVLKHINYNQNEVSLHWLRLRLESHPDYPSLIAVQDTLEEIGIESYVCQGTKEELKQENKPFLAHLNIYGGKVEFCKNFADAEEKIKDFDKQWSGHAMFISPAVGYGNSEHDKLYKKEKQNRLFVWIGIMLCVTAIIGVSALDGALQFLLLSANSISGLYFSWLIVQKELGIHNSVSDKICSMSQHSRCEAVLLSKGSRLFKRLSWGDVGLTYFSSSLVFLTILHLTHLPISSYFLISIAGLLFPVYSLYYQWKVVKQWCMLCNAVLAVLIINAGISLTGWNNFAWNITIVYATGILVFLLVFSFVVWWQIKSVYQKNLALLPAEIKEAKLKRNPQLFNALLQNEELKEDNLPLPNEAIHFGSPAAPYRLVIACNPYCGPCAKAHQSIEDLYVKYPGKLSVAVRFALTNNDDKDSKVLAAKQIIKAARQKPFEAIRDWYQLFDVEKFKQLHQPNGEDVSDEIMNHINWAKTVKINSTPTFFINGRILPGVYNWSELSGTLEFELKQ